MSSLARRHNEGEPTCGESKEAGAAWTSSQPCEWKNKSLGVAHTVQRGKPSYKGLVGRLLRRFETRQASRTGSVQLLRAPMRVAVSALQLPLLAATQRTTLINSHIATVLPCDGPIPRQRLNLCTTRGCIHTHT